jgi:hypothetical protein
MMWAKFVYRLSVGDVPVDGELRRTGINGMETVFASKGWTPSQLFTLGDPTYRTEPSLRQFAFSSLLHVVEDSYAKGHVERIEPTGGICPGAPEMLRPGAIQSFHSYTHQNPDKHGAEDSPNAFARDSLTEKPSAVDVGRTLRALFESKKPWSEVRPYFECVFALTDDAKRSGPSDTFIAD